MSLEAAIQENNALLREFISAVANFTGTVTSKDKTEPETNYETPAQDVPKAETLKAKAEEPDAKPVSRDEVKKLAVDLMKKKGREPAVQVFSKYKAANLGEIADDDLPAVYTDLKSALGD